MVTDNQKTATTIVLLAAVLLLMFVPLSHAIPLAFAADKGLFTGLNHATTSSAFASHKQGLFTGLSDATSTSLTWHGPTQGQDSWYFNTTMTSTIKSHIIMVMAQLII